MIFKMVAFVWNFLIASVFIVVASGKSIPLENINGTLQVSNCSCDWRYFKHYETKGCLLASTDSCGCPEKYICPLNQTQQTPSKVCSYQNKEYKVGSKIITSDACQACRCHDGTPPYISCITRECPDILDKDCHLIYKENKCCPAECIKSESSVATNKSCEYEGRFYPYGSKIYPIDDPCQICVCDENWNGVDNSSCYQQDCLFEKNKAKLDAGCIPIYHESRCCPVEFYCPSSHNLSTSLQSSFASGDNYNATFDQCIFGDQFYALGEELSIGNPCVKCTCAVSPEFTCVHQTCPPSPSDESCYANYDSGECCPTYECMLGDVELSIAGCPTPLCADSSCRIETPPGHECPTCVCGESTSELEHNNLEQVQQTGQNLEQFEQQHFDLTQQVSEPYHGTNDYSEDELQMMPITMQESEGQSSSVMEKMIALPETENSENSFSEGLAELDENSFEDNSSREIAPTVDEIQENEENSTSLAENILEDSYNKTASNEPEKVQKRSEISDAASNDQPKTASAEQTEFSQQEALGLSEDIEREGGESDGSNGDFDDELESFKNRVFDKNKTIINEILSINHVVKVPPGCPTPMCEGPWCKIGILPGEKCPTCICKRHSEP